MAENQTVETETTEQVVIEPVQTTDDVTPEVTEVKTFTQEQVDQFVKTQVYKERDSIGKKLGFDGKYSSEKMNDFITNTSEMQSKLDAVNSEFTEFKTQHETVIAEKQQLQEDYLINKFNVTEDIKKDFLTLVDSNLSPDKTIEQSAQEIKDRLSGKIFNDAAVSKVIIGADKATLKNVEKQQLEIDRLRNL